jgi:hypothetical protein
MDVMLWFIVASAAVLVLWALSFSLLDRLGPMGRAICEACSRAPVLDAVVFCFTHGPWIAAGVMWWRDGERGLWPFAMWLCAAILSQLIALVVWSRVHELMHRGAMKGPRISRTLNRRVGMARQHAAVLWTALAVPIFTMVRIGELVIYPPIVWLVRFPRYRSGEWINISRQKFDGLVGHDLIWCLYCDWMTGVWSLGSEMLRNVESFWCPIRFLSPEKCANCSIDFPDVNGGWVAHTKSQNASGRVAGGGDENGGMAAVVSKLQEQYPGPGGVNAWFGHPVRLTVKGKESRAHSSDTHDSPR